MKKRDGSIEKSARLVILLELADRGNLQGLTLQQIANMFPSVQSTSTIMRDLRDVERLREVLASYRKTSKKRKKSAPPSKGE
jgi:hypothetical protein